MKNSNGNSTSYQDLTKVLEQLMMVALSLVFSDGFRFFVVPGIRANIKEASKLFLEASKIFDEEVKKQKEHDATELLDEAVTWLRKSIAKWVKTQLLDHFEGLLFQAKKTFGVDAPEVVDAFLTLEEFKKVISGRIEDFSSVAQKARIFDEELTQIKSRVSKRKALVRSAEDEARKKKERDDRDRSYANHSSTLEALLENLYNLESSDVQ